MSEQAQGNKLYHAAVGFMVAEKSESNSWEQVAQFVHDFMHSHTTDPSSIKLLKREFSVVEKQVRKDFQVGRLPGAWRSAKSHAINAAIKGIPLVHESDGSAMPKTDVGKLLKASKAGLPVKPLDRFKHHISAAMMIYLGLGGSDKSDADAILLGISFSGAASPTPAMAGS